MPRVEDISGKIPVVVINNQDERLDVDAVDLDNSKLGRLMARPLLELGHRDAGYIARRSLCGRSSVPEEWRDF